MRTFLLQLAQFSLPLLLGVALLFALPYERKFAYHSMAVHCRNADWLFQRIYQDQRPIDLALVGSSRIMCGLDDARLEAHWDSLNQPLRVANLGFCRYGRNLHYALIRDLLAENKPKTLLIEVREQEDLYSHPDFGHLARTSDLFGSANWLNGQFFRDLGTGINLRFLQWKERLLGIETQPDSADIARPHSFIRNETISYCPPAQQQLKPRKLPPEPEAGWAKRVYTWRHQLPHHYLEKIARLCEAHQVELAFIYLPNYQSSPDQLPLDLALYEQWGKVYLPPADILKNPNHYMDPAHLNQVGATLLSDWLLSQMLLPLNQARLPNNKLP